MDPTFARHLPSRGFRNKMRRPARNISAIGTCNRDLYGVRVNSGGDKMAKGTVKWFNPTKGYGFIQPQAGGKDVFVHISAVERAGLSTLNEGQVVQYEIVSNRGKESAENLKVD